MTLEPAPAVVTGPVRIRAWLKRQNRHRLFIGVIALIVLLNFVGGVIVPYARYVLVTEPQWEEKNARTPCENEVCPPPPIPRHMVWDGILQGFWMNVAFTLAGLYLVFTPIGWIASLEVHWFPWQPFIWMAAVGSVPLTLRFGTPLGVWPRAGYASVIALLLSGFLSNIWSTVGN